MGLIYALGAYLSWGLVVPVHFRLLDAVPAGSILAHRIVWSSVLVVALLAILRRRVRNPFPLRRRHLLLVVSAGLIAVNWLLYLVAVQSGHMLDASLGYFINPLMSVALGALVLGERLRPVQAVAVGLAAAGVVLAVVLAGHLPWLSLCLAASFSLYGLVRKVVGVDAMVGFAAETFLLLPLAGIYLVGLAEPVVKGDPVRLALLLLTGVTTALPLIWFAAAAQRLTLSTLGLMQYLAPSCLLGLSVLVYGERLEPHRLVLFVLIWLALALYAADSFRAARRAKEPPEPAAAGPDRPGMRSF
ncbi:MULTISPECIES: EamA family transporter RarD [unclassified Methylobacterium]|uniref:EamA family transporter RarD n=1 Tax=unclassified Methylobacterium TaxID=2615210 RepID=UPI0006F95FB4|nr:MULTISPECIES: EamA family transporter RarD [unclassified Methylobacterium]KQO56066.1 chloramphenical resistance permease RarD [Methylobacterium sp. Leaf86]KQO95989.1 chloramphenical resistance permease RarD [Methylobacterium sp. Leaf91]